jgi:hypothetical protein
MLIRGNGKFSRNLRLAGFGWPEECRHEVEKVDQNDDRQSDYHQVIEKHGDRFD